MEERLSSKLTIAVDKALGNISAMVNSAVDKRLGDLTWENAERIEELKTEIEKRDRAILKEITNLKKTKTTGASAGADPKDYKEAVERVSKLEKKLEEIGNKNGPRPLIAENEYDRARKSLTLSPIPHRRDASLEDQKYEIFKFLERVLEVPEEVLEVVEIVRVTRLTREQSVTEEAVVCFNSASIRDTIFSYGLSLAGKSAQMGMVRSLSLIHI